MLWTVEKKIHFECLNRNAFTKVFWWNNVCTILVVPAHHRCTDECVIAAPMNASIIAWHSMLITICNLHVSNDRLSIKQNFVGKRDVWTEGTGRDVLKTWIAHLLFLPENIFWKGFACSGPPAPLSAALVALCLHILAFSHQIFAVLQDSTQRHICQDGDTWRYDMHY